MLYYSECGEVDLIRLKPNPLDLSSFSALNCWLGHVTCKNPSPNMTYNVFGRTLHVAVSIYPFAVYNLQLFCEC